MVRNCSACNHLDGVHFPANHECLDCIQNGVICPLFVPSDALEIAAAHLAGRGRGKYHRVDIEVGASGHDGKLLLDGVPLRGVRDFDLRSNVNGLTEINISLIVSVGRDEDDPALPSGGLGGATVPT